MSNLCHSRPQTAFWEIAPVKSALAGEGALAAVDSGANGVARPGSPSTGARRRKNTGGRGALGGGEVRGAKVPHAECRGGKSPALGRRLGAYPTWRPATIEPRGTTSAGQTLFG